MSAEQLAIITGSVLSIAFQIIPGLKDWFEPLSSDLKRLVIIGFLAVVAAAIYGLSCTPILDYVACTSDGAWLMFEYWAAAAIANQVTYQFIRKH